MVRVDLALSEVGGPMISYYDSVRDVARNAGMRLLIQWPQIWRAPLRQGRIQLTRNGANSEN